MMQMIDGGCTATRCMLCWALTCRPPVQAQAVMRFGDSDSSWSLSAKLAYNKPGNSIVVGLEAGSGLAVLSGFQPQLTQVDNPM